MPPEPFSEAETPGEDRRSATRYPSDHDASCHRPATADITPVQIKDVSSGGVGLLCGRRFERGTVLVLDLNDTALPIVSLLARVVRLGVQADGRWLVGCTLLGELSEEEVQALRQKGAQPAVGQRRTEVRVPQGLVAACRRDGPGWLGQWTAEVRDQSASGMGLVVACVVEEGARLQVALPVHGGEPAHDLVVQVLRSERRSDGRWLLNCQVCSGPTRARTSA
jgi:PilZ domain